MRAYSETTGAVLPLESGLEHDLMRVLDRDPAVVWLVSQPCRWTFVTDTGVRRHVPDLLAQAATGQVTVWDVRPPERQDETFASVVEMSRAACEAAGWAYEVFSGCGEVERLNLLWLNGFRADRPWHPAASWTILRHLRAKPDHSATLDELFALDDGKGELVSTVWHLIWCARLVTDLSLPLTAQTQVRTSPAREGRDDF